MVEVSFKAKTTIKEIIKGKKLISEGPEPLQDLSYEMITKNGDLSLIEEGIKFSEFAEACSNRNLDMEYRV